ncbi:MAG: lysine 2,3-aminomutase [Bradymonadia bacterium]|jgi:lysine 2,3-aminomutase
MMRAALDWRRQLVQGARDIDALLERGLVAPEDAEALRAVSARYEMLVSAYYLGLIDPTDPDCPIRRQALPAPEELHVRADELPDPIGDAAHAPTPILVHRYPGRVLMFPTYRCPMFCRYCFRKVALNDTPIRLHQALPGALAWLTAHPDVEEVILSGGDPLMLSTDRLGRLLDALETVPSVRRIRLHSRMPVTLPMRIDAELAHVLTRRLPIYLVAHFNHPRELTPEAHAAVKLLQAAGVTVLNQSVLLAGVNADAEILAALFTELVQWQVLPYYLHHPDMTVGTHHFRVSLDVGLTLMRGLRGRLTGLAQPTYVLEIPGGLGKVPVDSDFVQRTNEPGLWRLRSPLTGAWSAYRDPAAISPSP